MVATVKLAALTIAVALACIATAAASPSAYNPRRHVLESIGAHKLAAVQLQFPAHAHAQSRTVNEHGVTIHPDELTFTLTAFGKSFPVIATKTHGLMHDDYTEVVFDGRQTHALAVPLSVKRGAAVENCYYTGRVSGDAASTVAFRTCHTGASASASASDGPSVVGVFRALDEHFEVLYQTIPADAERSAAQSAGGDVHQLVAYRLSDYQTATAGTRKTCGGAIRAANPQPLQSAKPQPFSAAAVTSIHSRGAASAAAQPTVSVLTPCSGTKPRYLEVFVANSASRIISADGDTAFVMADSLATINLAVAYAYAVTTFDDYCINVQLRGQIAFEFADPITARQCNTFQPGSTCTGCFASSPAPPPDCSNPESTKASEFDVRALLFDWSQWSMSRYSVLQTLFKAEVVNIHFFTTYDFAGDAIGYGGLDTICSRIGRSSGVEDFRGTMNEHWAIYAHELGHNWGMDHDLPPYPPNTIYIMEPAIQSFNPNAPPIFSPASIAAAVKSLDSRDTDCTINKPDPNRLVLNGSVPLCGNGVLEAGESCDPGIEFNDQFGCGSNCQFVAGVQCSSHQPCCDGDGQFKPAGTVCRPVNSATCDVPESCTGYSGLCPADLVKPNGVACADFTSANGNCGTGTGVCYLGGCAPSRTSQCRGYCDAPFNHWDNCFGPRACGTQTCSWCPYVGPNPYPEPGYAYTTDVSSGSPCDVNNRGQSVVDGICVLKDCVPSALAVPNTIVVSRPVSGASVVRGEFVRVAWNSTGLVSSAAFGARVNIVVQDSSGTACVVASGISTVTGSYDWQSNGPAAGGYRIRVEDSSHPVSIWGYSQPFSVLDGPAVNGTSAAPLCVYDAPEWNYTDSSDKPTITPITILIIIAVVVGVGLIGVAITKLYRRSQAPAPPPSPHQPAGWNCCSELALKLRIAMRPADWRPPPPTSPPPPSTRGSRLVREQEALQAQRRNSQPLATAAVVPPAAAGNPFVESELAPIPALTPLSATVEPAPAAANPFGSSDHAAAPASVRLSIDGGSTGSDVPSAMSALVPIAGAGAIKPPVPPKPNVSRI